MSKSRMREMRDRCGKSLMRVHRETGIPYVTLQRWESGGIAKAPLGRALAVAKAIGCDVADLISE
ncbi:helix-turn-helix domain-containing protein [Olsenella phocaeensis]|uniref:helix-turn-helix domain-containing protein n=1 Tax=Olsenella phocaeensis TaxID=1852385 RepID=UPI0013562CE4|nr:helix-turn-helix transcriptional regulator [Olsenella phocaeensis]